MKPLIVLILASVIALFVIRLYSHSYDIAPAARAGANLS